VYAAFMIAVYPVGIPLFFFIMLWRYRHRLDEIGTRAQLGFLYDAYNRDMWWFEMLDVAHKLCVTCIIAFLPYDYQMPIGMVFVISYTAVILVGKPYLRKSDDRLHLVSQIEILLLLMSGNVFNREIVPDSLMSTVLSVVLIIAVLVFFLFFVVQAVQAGLKLISSFRKASAAQKLKLEGEADASVTPDRDDDGKVIPKPTSRMDKSLLKMADELEKLKKKNDDHPEFTISRRILRPMSRQHGEELRNFHMKANPLFEGHTALYDPTDKDNIVDDIKVNPLYAAKMRRELDEEVRSFSFSLPCFLLLFFVLSFY
jgi:Sec-independent protein translocase protein TatA